MRNWFLPETPDLLGALRAQADITREGMEFFVAWSGGDATAADDISAAEHRADDAKRRVQAELRAAFSTPLDPEDIYSLSERLDAVMNAAKNTVRESEVMAVPPDRHMGTMATQLLRGVGHLCSAFDALGTDDDEATSQSDAAVRACREIERLYRVAMSDLLAVSDVAEVMARRELYRRYSRAADAIEAVGERVWYTVVKSA